MIALPDLGGWVKLHRGLLLSPVWQNEYAYRVYTSLLLRTTYQDKTVAGAKLLAGQVLASQTDIGDVTGYSRKVVRAALDLLAQQRAINVCGQHGKTGTIFTVHSFPFMGTGRLLSGSDFSGPEIEPESGPSKNHCAGPTQTQSYSISEMEMDYPEHMVVAGLETQNLTDLRPESGPVINKDEEVENLRINPLPPLQKGAEGFSDSISIILQMWRESCAALDMAYIEDSKTIRGAAAIASGLLASGKADLDTIRQGMVNLLTMKKSDPKAKLYSLGTLSRSLSNFLNGPGVPCSAVTPVSLVWWRWTCDQCKDCMSGKIPHDAPPPSAIPCRVTRGCTGMMYPKKHE